jgi:thiol-disulfide isomerase/thioredoxin
VTQSNAQKATGTLRGDQNRLIFKQGFSFSGYERDPLFLNREGKNFYDISGVSGIDSITDGRAAVFADFDNDGDYDVFLSTIQGAGHLLFKNNVGQNNHWLRIELEGGSDIGRDAFSSVVRVKSSAGTLTKVKAGGSGYLSEHDPRLLFGLGQDERAQSIEVTWPNGKVESFQADAKAGSTLLLKEGTGKAEEIKLPSANLPDPLTRAQALALTLKIQLGQPFPDLHVKLLPSGETSIRKELKPGRRTLINLWATWCTPCRHEMPELQQLRARLAAKGLDLLGLNVDTDPRANIAQFLRETKAQYPILLGGAAAVEQLFSGEELSVPLTILLDEKGAVTELIPGWSGATKRRFEQLTGAELDSGSSSSQ